jgi:hypothetical protein
MTVLAAMVESDSSILVASDSTGLSQVETGTAHDGQIYFHVDAPLAWCLSGFITLDVDELSQELRSCLWPALSWWSFADEVSRSISGSNRRRRELLPEMTVDGATQMLIAGWLDHEPQILHIDPNGNVFSVKERGCAAIGSGGQTALTVFRAHDLLDLPISRLQSVENAMTVAAEFSTGCRLPVLIWRISKNSVERVK